MLFSRHRWIFFAATVFCALVAACADAEIQSGALDASTSRTEYDTANRIFEKLGVSFGVPYSDTTQEALIREGYFIRNWNWHGAFEERYKLSDSFVYVFQGDSYVVQRVLPLTNAQAELWTYKSTIYENMGTTSRRLRNIREKSPRLAKSFSPHAEFHVAHVSRFIGYLHVKAHGAALGETDFAERYLDSTAYNGSAATYVHEIVHLKYDSSPPHPTSLLALAREERTSAVAPACLGYESPYMALSIIAYWLTLPEQDPHRVAGDALFAEMCFRTRMDFFQLGELSEKELLDLFWEIEGNAIRRLGLEIASVPKRIERG